MESQKDRTLVIAVVTGLIALLLGLCLGALVGAMGGFAIGRSRAVSAIQRFQQPELILPKTRQTPAPEFRWSVPPGMMGMTGALVQEVIEKSPAADAGLAALDVITQVDDTPLDANHPLLDVLGRYKPGDQVKLTVWRAGDTRTLMVRLGKHPNDPARPYLGVKYLEVGSAGVQPGD